MAKFAYTLIDTETDETVMTLTVGAEDYDEACQLAEDEAEFQGFFVGSVWEVK